MIEAEEWRDVVGFEGYYSVSSEGRVRSGPRDIAHWRGGTSRLPGAFLKPDTNRKYLYVVLCFEGRTVKKSIHRLVCEAFNGPSPEKKPLVLHSDGDKMNNTPGNLRWGSSKENMADKALHGTNHELNKTHCPQGHPYFGENLYVVPKSGKRQCRACTSERGKRYRKERND